jgi:hypothetical protein
MGARRRLVRRQRVLNGCVQPVLRPERSRGCRLGAVGNVAASSAQSKRVGGGETACLGSSWGELGQTGGERGTRVGQGVFTCVDGVVGGADGV